jgi:hypothetical protein
VCLWLIPRSPSDRGAQRARCRHRSRLVGRESQGRPAAGSDGSATPFGRNPDHGAPTTAPGLKGCGPPAWQTTPPGLVTPGDTDRPARPICDCAARGNRRTREEASPVSVTAWTWICVGAALWLAGAGALSLLIGRVVCRRDVQVPTLHSAAPGACSTEDSGLTARRASTSPNGAATRPHTGDEKLARRPLRGS